MMNRNAAKRSLMFIQKEDYNFLAYSTIILLNSLECNCETKRFKDFRKIAYLVDFVNEGGNPSEFSEQQLVEIYQKAQIKKKLLHHLLIVLKNKNFIDVTINSSSKTIDLWLNKESIPKEFFNKEIFGKEIENVKMLKDNYTASLRRLTIKTLVEKIFNNNNILTWEV
ncbi:hypothetical protein [Chryseobacterium luquanense]|uniref:Uncharacterized protein n=1 Tax=Chryseobacterium luquanense TaxID=2983766 RepID=A0ABT3Y1Z0_9FLAO|nr:hypothetical protein [Chryseobacterium luquanense]MCX8532165.1 hypothetical protein [Chryseobacterium luquanense]